MHSELRTVRRKPRRAKAMAKARGAGPAPTAEAEQTREKEEAKGLRAFREAGERLLFVLLNGRLWRGLVHLCVGPWCCDNFARHETWKKLIPALVEFVLPAAPGAPEVGKWTKLGPALDKALLGVLVGRVSAAAFQHGFSKMALTLVDARLGGLDLHLVEELAFSATVSKTARLVLDFLADAATGP